MLISEEDRSDHVEVVVLLGYGEGREGGKGNDAFIKDAEDADVEGERRRSCC